jgi:biopolymer transport protein ExbD
VKIDNPSRDQPPPTRPEVIDLSIDFDGTLLWNNTPVDRTTMQGLISREATKNPQPEVHITVDKFAKYEIVAQALADLQHRGLKKIGFVNNDFF